MSADDGLTIDEWADALDASAVVDLWGEETGPDYDPDAEPDDDDE